MNQNIIELKPFIQVRGILQATGQAHSHRDVVNITHMMQRGR